MNTNTYTQERFAWETGLNGAPTILKEKPNLLKPQDKIENNNEIIFFT